MSGGSPAGAVLSPDALEERLRAIGAERYHDRHPFNVRMHEGTLTRGEIRTWARNRYYYQTRIPLKDSLIVAKANDPAFRREWLQRIQDHDGTREGEGGLALGRSVSTPAPSSVSRASSPECAGPATPTSSSSRRAIC